MNERVILIVNGEDVVLRGRIFTPPKTRVKERQQAIGVIFCSLGLIFCSLGLIGLSL